MRVLLTLSQVSIEGDEINIRDGNGQTSSVAIPKSREWRKVALLFAMKHNIGPQILLFTVKG